ncbi:MAG: RagB/SusD family nutrient uptake outer membrane protein, partial [Chitinophagales bacterium]
FVDIDFPMFRLADVYLMYAEAAVRGGADMGLGITYFNNVRERAYGDASHNVVSIDLDKIINERARELQWEGQRRTDLIRFGLFTGGTYLWPYKGNVPGGTATDEYLNIYPLPNADIVANPNLVQNPGY